MTPKGMYTVQKSRSFGGLRSSSQPSHAETTAGTPADYRPDEPHYHSGGGGRRTPNLGSLRRRFQSRKAASTENNHYRPEEEYSAAATPSWKKRHKLANLFRWFKKGDAATNTTSNSSKELATTAEGARLNADYGNCAEVKLMSLPSVPERPAKRPGSGGGSGPQRSASLDSLCSVASAASSFAFVPPERCRGVLGSRILLAPQKRIALGINCGPDTYRARVPHSGGGEAAELTLRTKYKLFPGGESLPGTLRWEKTLTRRNESCEFDHYGDNGTMVVQKQNGISHRNFRDIDTVSDDDNDSDDTVLDSISQRGQSPPDKRPTWPHTEQVRPDLWGAQLPSAQPEGQLIKARELTGQLLHPMTIKAAGSRPKTGKLPEFPPSSPPQVKKVGSPTPLHPPPPAGREKGAAGQPPADWLPSMSADRCSSQSGSCNPFGDTQSLAPTTLLGEEDEKSSYSLSPRNSGVYSEGEEWEGRRSGGVYRPLIYHIPGKRRAPLPPSSGVSCGRPLSPASTCSEGSSSHRIYARKKGRAPPPPVASESDKKGKISGDIMHCETVLPQAGAATASLIKNNNSDNRQCTTTIGCNNDDDGELIKDDISAASSPPPTSPQLEQRSRIMAAHAHNDSLILQDGVLRSLRDSTQDLTGGSSSSGVVPLSPRPWYKRSVARDEKRTGTNSNKKKSKSPDNLPEIQPGREGITLKETFEEKYSYFIRKVLVVALFFSEK